MSDIGNMIEGGGDGPGFEFIDWKPPERATGQTLEEVGELALNGSPEEQDKAIAMLCDVMNSDMSPFERSRFEEFCVGLLRRKQASWKSNSPNKST